MTHTAAGHTPATQEAQHDALLQATIAFVLEQGGYPPPPPTAPPETFEEYHAFVDRVQAITAVPLGAYSLDADPEGIRARAADAITGALAFGAQGINRPPEGHWLTPFWEAAQAEVVVPAVPKGWRLVPVEPTERMAIAGGKYAECGLPANAVFGYRAMLAAGAAPQAPARTMHITELHGTYGWDGRVRGAWSRSYDAPMPAPDAPETPRLIGVDMAAGPDATAYWTAEPAPFQQRVQPWLMECFGATIAGDREERNHRFLEEALELVQSCGCSASEAHQLVDYVFGRPVGEPAQEVGGVMVTLAALCLANGLDMHHSGELELARIWTKVDAIRAKQAAKPKHSPLPEHTPTRAADSSQGAQIVWPKARDVGRIGDMSPSDSLRVGLDGDNDVYVSVCGGDGVGSVEFCTPGPGGGKSRRTRVALLALMVAMEADNADDSGRDWWARRMGGAKQEGEAA